MKRDMDLVRKLLFYLEENQGTELLLASNIKIDGYEDDAIYYNLKIMGEGNLITGRDISAHDCRNYIIYSITWEGHKVLSQYSTEVSESIGDGSVFVVHGQNHGKLAEVKHLLGQLGIECCVLQDEPNSGQTIIEKFESHGGNASYAIVLLTADDIGGAKQNNEVQSRARQNVIFEFGYFCGKLGRHKTAVLYEPGVEIPSDLRGLAYVELDSSGAWKYRLADELSQDGYPVDKNKIT